MQLASEHGGFPPLISRARACKEADSNPVKSYVEILNSSSPRSAKKSFAEEVAEMASPYQFALIGKFTSSRPAQVVSALFVAASIIGSPLKVDEATADGLRLSMARECYVNGNKPLPVWREIKQGVNSVGVEVKEHLDGREVSGPRMVKDMDLVDANVVMPDTLITERKVWKQKKNSNYIPISEDLAKFEIGNNEFVGCDDNDRSKSHTEVEVGVQCSREKGLKSISGSRNLKSVEKVFMAQKKVSEIVVAVSVIQELVCIWDPIQENDGHGGKALSGDVEGADFSVSFKEVEEVVDNGPAIPTRRDSLNNGKSVQPKKAGLDTGQAFNKRNTKSKFQKASSSNNGLDEHSARVIHNPTTVNEFNDFSMMAGLLDAGFVGDKFTWTNSRVWKRLDRVLISPSWNDEEFLVRVEYLNKPASDHYPLLISFLGIGSIRLQSKHWRLKAHLKCWNVDVFGNIHEKVKEAEDGFSEAEKTFDTYPSVEIELKCLSVKPSCLMDEKGWSRSKLENVLPVVIVKEVVDVLVQKDEADKQIWKLSSDGKFSTNEANAAADYLANLAFSFPSDRVSLAADYLANLAFSFPSDRVSLAADYLANLAFSFPSDRVLMSHDVDTKLRGICKVDRMGIPYIRVSSEKETGKVEEDYDSGAVVFLEYGFLLVDEWK
ncbi:hypothetical protein ZIOFF_042862 [Zingiber officinale]|uniref:Uncharacterized protein n=1 Tax=Zingiber officinale TaxID=94328 RepID=A0A8J5KZ49_ZINOF|nr:hypothetical protein ZIOFF_042862 [Zingiber officinale]